MGIAKSLLNRLGNDKTVRAWLVANDNTSASGFYKKMGLKKDSPYKLKSGQTNTQQKHQNDACVLYKTL